MQMILKVRASAINDSDRTSDATLLASLHGVTSDESFSEYIIDSGSDLLIALPIEGGTLILQYDETQKQLWSIVNYLVPRQLNTEEEAALIEYTIGQLTDGIGENLTNEYLRKRDIFIYPADHAPREVSISYQ